MKVIIDVDKVLESLRNVCHTLSNSESDMLDLYHMAWISGALAVIGKDWQDLCGECEGCKMPVCPHKNMKKTK